MTTPVDKAFEAEALTLALKQPLTVNRDFGRTWLTLQFSSDSGTAAFVEIDSLDGKLMHLARTRLVMAGPSLGAGRRVAEGIATTSVAESSSTSLTPGRHSREGSR